MMMFSTVLFLAFAVIDVVSGQTASTTEQMASTSASNQVPDSTQGMTILRRKHCCYVYIYCTCSSVE